MLHTHWKLATALALSVGVTLACASLDAPAPTAAPLPTVAVTSISPIDAPTALPAPPTDTPAPERPRNRIAYLTVDSGAGSQVQVVAATGGVAQIIPLDTETPNDYVSTCFPTPQWSPDGRYLLLTRRPTAQNGQDQVIVVDTETNAIQAIPDAGASAVWGPDSQHIFYTTRLNWESFPPAGDTGVWVWDLATRAAQQVFPPLGADYVSGRLRLAPDGTRFSTHSAQYEGAGQFGLVNADGSNFQKFDFGVGGYDWSPDSQWIVFDEVTYIPMPPTRLMVMDRDGDNVGVVVEKEGFIPAQPNIAPDNQTIAFINYPDITAALQTYELWLVDTDGQNLRQVIVPGLNEFYWLDWAPDSQALVVAGQRDVYVAPLDGNPPMRLGDGSCPVWQP